MYANILVVALAAVATAVPTWGNHDSHNKDIKKTGDVCNNGNSIHCCDTETAKSAISKNVIGADLKSLLGQCNDITVAIIGDLIPLKKACTSQAVCCGEQKQGGLVNLGCTAAHL